jgi:c-di-GMP-binding flagellar brake protein YcgR
VSRKQDRQEYSLLAPKGDNLPVIVNLVWATMENHPERRDTRRIIVGSEYTIHFVVKGHPFRSVRITNLSFGGCFAVVGQGDATLFGQGTILEQLAFEHPDLAGGSITAEVRFVLGGPEGGSGFDFLGLGIQFLAVPSETKKALMDFVERSSDLPAT